MTPWNEFATGAAQWLDPSGPFREALTQSLPPKMVTAKMLVYRFCHFATAIAPLLFATPAASQLAAQSDLIRSAKDYRVDTGALASFSPRARADLIATILEQWRLAEDAGITSAIRVTHFVAQMATETGGLRAIAEDLNYSAERLRIVFPRRVTPQQATKLANRPVLIANHVYGGRLGNRLPNDGWVYRGSGLMQLTGRANFSGRGKELKLPLEENPEMVRTAGPAFQAAVAYWRAHSINAIADTGDLRKVRLAVNGGTNGLEEAGIWLARARRYLRVTDARTPVGETEESVAVEERLRSLGFLLAPKSGERSVADDIESGVKRFQRSRGLPETGQVDEDTFYELVNPDNFRKFGR